MKVIARFGRALVERQARRVWCNGFVVSSVVKLAITTPVILTVLATAGCAVGTTYEEPSPPSIRSYTFEALPSETLATQVFGGAAQRFRLGDDLKGRWWTLFGSPQLDALIREGMHNHPDIAAQQAALRRAGEFVQIQRGSLFPALQGTIGYERERVAGASVAPGFSDFITTLYYSTINVSYTFDVFGAKRRALESAEAQALAQSFELEASYITITSNIAGTVIELASLSDQIVATQDIVSIEEEQLNFIRRRFDAGSQTRADVLQQQSNLASVRATLPQLVQQRTAVEHQLAVLVGRLPADSAPSHFSLSDLKLPEDLPLSLPSVLAAQRPDIRAAAARVHQASAAIGVATANLLPQLTLTGSLGYESFRAGDLFRPASEVWSVATGITQPLLEGGSLRAKRRAAVDAYDQARARYQLTLLQGFQNVADALTAICNDAQSLSIDQDALTAATESLQLIQKQYDAGAVNYVSLLAAQQTYQRARLAYVIAVERRFLDTVTLFQALGGGWWNRTDPGVLRDAALDTHSRQSTH
jgi:NodT family efflux transporter outer membrane factor (OMF) lipoprotein